MRRWSAALSNCSYADERQFRASRLLGRRNCSAMSEWAGGMSLGQECPQQAGKLGSLAHVQWHNEEQLGMLSRLSLLRRPGVEYMQSTALPCRTAGRQPWCR